MNPVGPERVAARRPDRLSGILVLMHVFGADRGPTAVGPLLEHAPIAVLLTDAVGALLGWNRRAGALLELGTGHHGQRIDGILPGASSLLAPADPSPTAAPPSLVVPVPGPIDV
jgi:hypothetical protein